MNDTTLARPKPAMDQPKEKPSTGQALAAQSPGERSTTTAITSPAEFARRMTLWQRENYHVLSPVAQLGDLPNEFVITPTLVAIDPNPKNGEVYQDKLFCDGDEVAIAKPGLAKIALAAGMSIRTERTDPRTIPHYWEVRATARFVGIDGTVQEMDATAEYDLREGSPRINKIVKSAQRNKRDPSAQIEGARQYGLRGCEARAINAVIRQYGIRQKYTQGDLQKPFVVVRVRYEPNMSNPAQALAVTQARIAGTSLMFGGARALPAAPMAEPETIDVIGVGGNNPDESQPAAQPQPRQVEAVSHDMEAGIYEIRLDGGELVTTGSRDIAGGLLEAKKANQPILPDVVDGELRSFRLASAAASPKPTESQRQPAQQQATASSSDVVVAKVHSIVELRDGKRNDGSIWRFRKVVTEAGDWFTFEDDHVKVAAEAKSKGWQVRIVRADENPKYPDQLDIERITLIDPRQQTLPMGEEEDRY